MLRKLIVLAHAGIDDDSKGQRLIRVEPQMLDDPLNAVIVNAEFLACEIGYRNSAFIDYGAGDGHEFHIGVECGSTLRRGREGEQAGEADGIDRPCHASGSISTTPETRW